MTLALQSHDLPAVDAAGPSLTFLPSLGERIRFTGSRSQYWRLMMRGATLEGVTLGIYRFWLFTDMRRFLWTNTEIGDESFEYTGTAVELLLGFLMAIGMLIPVYAMLFVSSLEMGALSQWSGVVAFAVLAVFGQYAAYRARRYRLTRTVWRGLRFHQSGSAISYALRAMLWWVAVAMTLGLAYPWMEASLERYKMRNTFYGDLGGRFAATGGQLFVRGILLWVVVVAPLPAAAVTLWSTRSHWSSVGSVLPDTVKLPGVAALLALGLAASTLIAVIAYPAFQAIVMRWWLGGLRLGTAAAASKLRIRHYYGAYLRYIVYVVMLTIAFAIALGLAAWIVKEARPAAFDFMRPSTPRDVATAIAGIGAYVIYILACSTIYQVVVKFRLWQVAAESVVISGLAALDNVHAGEATSSALGEGLANALGGGAI
jgi:uncharacterized membrane protein YjgN (DUF898 family)